MREQIFPLGSHGLRRIKIQQKDKILFQWKTTLQGHFYAIYIYILIILIQIVRSAKYMNICENIINALNEFSNEQIFVPYIYTAKSF